MDSPSHRPGGPIKWTRPRDAWNSHGMTDPWGGFLVRGGSSQDGRKWLITMVSKFPKDRDVPLTNGRFMAYKWGLPATYELG